MFRKICCIVAVICIFVSSFALSSSAAVSTFESDLAPVTSYDDFDGTRHDFFAFYGSSNGVLIEFIYPFPAVTCTVSIENTDLGYSFRNFSTVDMDIYISVRNLKTGVLYYDDYISLTGLSTLTFSYNSPPSVDIDKIYLPSFSSFSCFQFFNCLLTVSFIDARFLSGSVVFNGFSTQYGVLLTNLTEPVSDGFNRFIVLASEEEGVLFHLSLWSASSSFDPLDVTCLFSVSSVGDYILDIDNRSDTAVRVYLSSYTLSTGFFRSSNYDILTSGSGIVFTLLGNRLVYPAVTTYGIAFDNHYDYSIDRCKILWNFDIVNAEAIAAETLLLLNQLYVINRSLGNLEDYLNLIDMDLFAISDFLEDIRDSMLDEGESFTQPPTDALEDYLSDESKVYDVLPTGMQQNIDTAFGSADVVFSGNGSFALIRGLMQGLVFDVPKLSGFVFFALAIGIAVLILGRKVNSG